MLRLIGYLFGIGVVFALIGAAVLAYLFADYNEGLPDIAALRNYEPPVTTRVHADNGQLIAEYARERRLFLPIQAMPARLKEAFLAAEDKGFYEHPGLDFTGIVNAMVINFQNVGTGRRLVGASTITQQVAKNFLLTNEVSYDRKIKEALLSMRIEQAFTKDQILELYLNEIYLGLGAYGVAAASLQYFDKSVNELTIAEVAYLAALPKAPGNYHPFRFPDRAVERRNWVIGQMLENRFITDEEAQAARQEPLTVTPRQSGPHLLASDYFAEEVRRELLALYTDKGLYEGGLSVRSTLDPALQVTARRVLHDGLLRFDVRKGWNGPYKRIDLAANADWGALLGDIPELDDVPEWRMAVVLGFKENGIEIGLHPGRDVSGRLSDNRQTGFIDQADLTFDRWHKEGQRGEPIRRGEDAVILGDVVFAEPITGDRYRLRQIPEVSGAIVAMEPYTGRVKAMVGGFSFALSEFNRATQAYRQPGSSFKPFVYAAALDNGYTPASVVLDAPIEIPQGPGLPLWRPKNYGGKFYGPSTLRTGIERSRNVMTVQLARDMGMPLVAEYAERFGIYDEMSPVLAMSLGSGETTVQRMVTAYSMLANGGRRITPTLIDRIQDRYGRTIYKHDPRLCESCSAQSWIGQEEPQIVDQREQILDAMTAYQITSMMEGVVQRGTATVVREVGKPIAGKTGTTNEEKDAWFVGFSPNLTVGVFVGYDKPIPMGRGYTGGQIAAPIFKDFMKVALADDPGTPFNAPAGLEFIPINKSTGQRARGTGPGIILEAFKPGLGPSERYQIIGFENALSVQTQISPAASQAISSGTGGLY